MSVVTPSLNQQRFIEETIRSVREQDYPAVEHIVVDGGSTDGTGEVLRRYPHLRWISEPDRGQADAVNKGFRMAGGDILAWLNADDVYLPGAVSAAVAELAGTGCGLVYGGWRQIDEDGSFLRDIPPEPFDYRELLEVRNMIAQPATFFTREAFEAVGGLDPDYHYAMDYDLWLKIAARFEVRTVPQVLAAFRRHAGSKSGAEAERFWPEVRRISRRHGGRFVSDMYVREQARRRPQLGRVLKGYRIIAERRYRELLDRARRLVR